MCPEQIISASGTQYPLLINEDGSINVSGINIAIGSLALTLEDVFVRSGNAWFGVGSSLVTNFPATYPGSVSQSTNPWIIGGSVAITNTGSVIQSTNPWIVLGSVQTTGSTNCMQITSPWIVEGSVFQSTTPWAINGSITIMGSGGCYYQDKATCAIPTIEYEHHEIHDGDTYQAVGSSQLQIGQATWIGFTTPNTTKWCHTTWDASTTQESVVKIWEGATLSGGIAEDVYNRNRNSSKTPTAVLTILPTISGVSATSGANIHYRLIPANKGMGLTKQADYEWVLKSGTAYIFELKSLANSNDVGVKVQWYEHTDKVQQF